jgi:hypothetical protein
MNTACNICNAATFEHARMLVRKKYAARLLRCSNCGFLFVDDPLWLAEAYAEPINRSDTGYVSRNLWARDKLRDCIELHLNPGGVFLDYAAGYGLFVRLMRDLGYDFQWCDLYCQNLFCRGFEAPQPVTGPYEMVTSFEMLEHLPNPNVEMERIAQITSCFIYSSLLVPEPAPQPSDWWYYGFEHGQHVAFYTRQSLELLGKKFGFHLVTDGANLHAFSRKPLSPVFFSPPTIPRWCFWKSRKVGADRKSLTMADHDFIENQLQH